LICNLVTTCIAIALFGDEVSPRFCFAGAILVVNFVKGREVWRQVLPLGAPWLPRRMAQLASLGVNTLLCGAFNRAYLPTAERLGIRVLTGMAGDAEEALTKFLRGHAVPGRARRRHKQTTTG
jgi:predicted Fe-Mo cluster-binding NifX family protein